MKNPAWIFVVCWRKRKHTQHDLTHSSTQRSKVEYRPLERLVPTERTSMNMKEQEAWPCEPGSWQTGQREDWNPGALPRRLTYPLLETKVRSESSSTRRRILLNRLGMQQLRTSFLTIGIIPLITDEAAPQ